MSAVFRANFPSQACSAASDSALPIVKEFLKRPTVQNHCLIHLVKFDDLYRPSPSSPIEVPEYLLAKPFQYRRPQGS